MKWLATWLMDHMAAQGRSDWSLAMRREYDELDHGHLSWAFGAVLVGVRGRYNELLCLPLVTLGLHFIAPIFAAFVSVPAFRYSGDSWNQIIALAYPLPWAMALEFFRLGTALMVTVLGGIIYPLLIGYSASMEILELRLMDYVMGVGATAVGGVNAFGVTVLCTLWSVGWHLGAHISRLLQATKTVP